MILRDLIPCLARVTASGPLDTEVCVLTASSREVVPGVLFAAIRGTAIDGHRFIGDALAAGARVILAECAPPPDLAPALTWLHVPDSRAALAVLASRLWPTP